MNTTLLHAALAYAARGWRVFPCHTPTAGGGCSCRQACGRIGKHPRTQHGLKDATRDEATLRRWWRQWPQANIAIATGAVSGLAVLDEDSYKGGDSSRMDLEQSYGPLPKTVQQLTGGGGVQYVFAHPGTHVKNGVETLGPGLDIRGDGGYVVVPPSLHLSGKRYTWDVTHDPEDTPIAPMPAWLVALCQDTTRREAPPAGDPICDGHRNDTLFRVGCSFRAKGCTEAVIRAALREMNATQCQPPLPEDEVATIAASCATYAPGTSSSEQRRNGTAPRATSDEAPLPYSDYSNALAFVADHGEDLRYCYPWRSWLVWTGTHWERDISGAVMRMAKTTIKRLARQVEALDDTAAKTLLGHVKASLAATKLKAMVELAQSEDGIPVQPEVFDVDPWLLNCQNGTLDLRTGTRQPHSQADLLTKCLPIASDPEALCPTWDAFLWRIMGGTCTPDDPDMSAGALENRQAADERAQALVSFLQRAVGYSLTGSTREQCMFLLCGPTKTGKSTFLATLRALLGPYGQQADMSSFMHKDREDVRNDLADLAGSRVVCALESQEGRRLAEALIKQVTGGVDLIKARFLFQEHFTYKPQFKIFLGTNHKPVIRDTDSAIWERIRLVPFIVQIPKEDRDKRLEETLRQELPGILAWAVQGCLQWQALDTLHEPDAVEQATQGYRNEMDVLGQFMTECCLVGSNYRVKAADLYDAYKRWCDQNGERAEVQRAWGMALTERGLESGKVNGRSWWKGITLIPVDDVDEGRREKG